jgi:alpha-tubulin suppressor-like RCC1 family protein
MTDSVVRRWSTVLFVVVLVFGVVVGSASMSGASVAPGVYAMGGVTAGWGLLGNGDPLGVGDDEPVGPISSPSTATAIAVAAGGTHALALLADGTVLSWGSTFRGDLGRPASGEFSSTPGVVSGLGAGSGVVAIAAGSSHSLALRADGSVVAWGDNDNGQLGDGTATWRSAPVPVLGLGPGSGVVSVAAGFDHSVAALADGSVVAWGYNQEGEVGDGTTTQRRKPTPVLGLGPGSGITTVAAGLYHTLALADTGALFSWGFNSAGALGDGTRTTRLSPVAVSGLGAGSGVVAIDGGGHFSGAVRADGSLLTWGMSDAGRRCDGRAGSYLNPVNAQDTPAVVPGWGPGSGVVALSLGWEYMEFVTADGALWGCGGDRDGAIGVGQWLFPDGVAVFPSPVVAHGLGPGSGVVGVSAGANHTLVVAGTSPLPNTGAYHEVSIGDVEIVQGDTGTRTATLTLNLDEPAAASVKVAVKSHIDSSNRAALSAINKTVTFLPGETVKKIPVAIYGSSTNEQEIQAALDIISMRNAVTNKYAGTITIEPDISSTQVSASVSDVTVVEGDAGANKVSFTISLNRASSGTVTVNYKTVDGDAHSGDYTPKTGKVTFLAGQLSKSIVVSIAADSINEGDETFGLDLTQSTGAALHQSIGTATIEDNDG